MMILVVGGSGSGKSAYAERCAEAVSDGKRKYYLATMQICDGESRKKAERHRRLRKGKGFVTIEQPVSVSEAIPKMEAGEKTVLLECMSNLMANEMFGAKAEDTEEKPSKEEVAEKEKHREIQNKPADKIEKEIAALQGTVTHLIIVTNNVFEDGILYEKFTMEYMEALGRINEKLAAAADEVIEVTAGIPIAVKTRGTEGKKEGSI